MGKIKFDEFVSKHAWLRLMPATEIEALAKQVWDALKNGTEIENDPRHLEIARAMGKLKRYTVFENAYKQIAKQLLPPNAYFYKPIEAGYVSRNNVKSNADVAWGSTPGMLTRGRVERIKAQNKFDLKDKVSDPDKPEPVVQTPEEVKIAEDAEEKQRQSEEKQRKQKEKEITKAAKNKAAQEIVDKFEKKHNEESVEKQIKNTVTKIAKNRELMNLSREQLRDYLRDAYEISDENALNNMFNAVVAKRAELLANKQLKQEELTEIDISKLQEQSQRDFEKKLQDQNLRYILPAQIEKRERLVQNRLNPELLKSGY